MIFDTLCRLRFLHHTPEAGGGTCGKSRSGSGRGKRPVAFRKFREVRGRGGPRCRPGRSGRNRAPARSRWDTHELEPHGSAGHLTRRRVCWATIQPRIGEVHKTIPSKARTAASGGPDRIVSAQETPTERRKGPRGAYPIRAPFRASATLRRDLRASPGLPVGSINARGGIVR